MFGYTKQFQNSIHLFPYNHLLSQNTKINVVTLDIMKYAPTPGHFSPYRQVRAGRRVFMKVAKTATTVITNYPKQLDTPQNSIDQIWRI